MSTPQLENGYIRIATEIWEELCRVRIPGEAMQVLFVVIRKTYGWNKKKDVIALSQFVEMTGMLKSHVSRNIKKLQEIGVISVTQKGNRNGNEYEFIKDSKKWKPLPKKVTLPKKVISVTQKGKASLPKKGTTIDTTTIDTKQKTLTPPSNGNFTPLGYLIFHGVDKNTAEDFLTTRRTKKLAPTETAFKGLDREIKKTGKSWQEIITICCENSWGGFKSSWKTNLPQKGLVT